MLLPAVVKTVQVVVAVQILDLHCQLTQQRSLAGFTQVIDELAVTLIQPEPLAGVLLHAISQRFHLQLRYVQHLDELRRMLQRQVHILEALKPVALTALAYPLLHLLSGHCTGHYGTYQLTEDLAVDQLEIIQLQQATPVQSLQLVVDLQHRRALLRQCLETLLMRTTVLPAFEEHQRLSGQSRLVSRVDPKHETSLKQLDNEIVQPWLLGAIAIGALHLLPQISIQAAAFD